MSGLPKPTASRLPGRVSSGASIGASSTAPSARPSTGTTLEERKAALEERLKARKEATAAGSSGVAKTTTSTTAAPKTSTVAPRTSAGVVPRTSSGTGGVSSIPRPASSTTRTSIGGGLRKSQDHGAPLTSPRNPLPSPRTPTRPSLTGRASAAAASPAAAAVPVTPRTPAAPPPAASPPVPTIAEAGAFAATMSPPPPIRSESPVHIRSGPASRFTGSPGVGPVAPPDEPLTPLRAGPPAAAAEPESAGRRRGLSSSHEPAGSAPEGLLPRPSSGTGFSLADGRRPASSSGDGRRGLSADAGGDSRRRDVEQQLAEREREVKALEGRIAKQREEFAVQIAESEAAAAQARERATELERRLQEAGGRLEAAAGERRARDGAAREAEAQLAEVRRQLSEAQEVAEAAAVEKELAEERAESLQHELDALRLKVEELETDKELLLEEARVAAGAAPAAGAEGGAAAPAGESTVELRSLREQNGRLREALQKVHEVTSREKAGLQAKVRELEREAGRAREAEERAERLQRELAAEKRRAGELEERVEEAGQAAAMAEGLIERNAALDEEVERLRGQVQDLEDLKELSEAIEEEHRTETRKAAEELGARDVAVEEARAEATALRERAADLERTLEQFRERTRALQAANEGLRAGAAAAGPEARERLQRAVDEGAASLRALGAAVDLELARVAAAEAALHRDCLAALVPEAVARGEGEAFAALLAAHRSAAKADALAAFLLQRYPPPATPAELLRPGLSTATCLAALRLRERALRATSLARQVRAGLVACPDEAAAGRLAAAAAREGPALERALDRLLQAVREDMLGDAAEAPDLDAALERLGAAAGRAVPGEELRRLVPANQRAEEDARRLSLQLEGLEAALARMAAEAAQAAAAAAGEDGDAVLLESAGEGDERALLSRLQGALSTLQHAAKRFVDEAAARPLAPGPASAPLFERLDAAAAAAARAGVPQDGQAGALRAALGEVAAATRRLGEAFEGLVAGDFDAKEAKGEEAAAGAMAARAARLRGEIAAAAAVRGQLERERREREEAERRILQRDKELEEAAVKYAKLAHRLDALAAKAEQTEAAQSEAAQLRSASEIARREEAEVRERLAGAEAQLAKARGELAEARAAAASAASAASGPAAALARLREAGPRGASPVLDASAAANELATARLELTALRTAVRHLSGLARRAANADVQRMLADLPPLPLGPPAAPAAAGKPAAAPAAPLPTGEASDPPAPAPAAAAPPAAPAARPRAVEGCIRELATVVRHLRTVESGARVVSLAGPAPQAAEVPRRRGGVGPPGPPATAPESLDTTAGLEADPLALRAARARALAAALLPPAPPAGPAAPAAAAPPGVRALPVGRLALPAAAAPGALLGELQAILGAAPAPGARPARVVLSPPELHRLHSLLVA